MKKWWISPKENVEKIKSVEHWWELCPGPLILHICVSTKIWTWFPPPIQTDSSSLCLAVCALCRSVVVLPPHPPCLLHTGTLPFGETDWLWWRRLWGSARGVLRRWRRSFASPEPAAGSLCYRWTHVWLCWRNGSDAVNVTHSGSGDGYVEPHLTTLGPRRGSRRQRGGLGSLRLHWWQLQYRDLTARCHHHAN